MCVCACVTAACTCNVHVQIPDTEEKGFHTQHTAPMPGSYKHSSHTNTYTHLWGRRRAPMRSTTARRIARQANATALSALCTHTYTHARKLTHTHARKHTHTRTHANTHTRTHLWGRRRASMCSTNARRIARQANATALSALCTHTYTHARKLTHTRTHARTQTHTHAHTCGGGDGPPYAAPLPAALAEELLLGGLAGNPELDAAVPVVCAAGAKAEGRTLWSCCCCCCCCCCSCREVEVGSVAACCAASSAFAYALRSWNWALRSWNWMRTCVRARACVCVLVCVCAYFCVRTYVRMHCVFVIACRFV